MGTTLTGTQYWQPLKVLIAHFGYNLKFPCASVNFGGLNVLKCFFFLCLLDDFQYFLWAGMP